MTLPVKAISYSQLYSYFHHPDEWYDRYVRKVKIPPTQPMMLGTICHEAFEQLEWKDEKLVTKFDYRGKLIQEGFMPDKARMIDEYISYLENYYRGKELPVEREVSYYPVVNGLKLSVKLDGRWPAKGVRPATILDYKTGGTLWTEEKMHESFQVTWYSFGEYLINKRIPVFIVHTFSTKNGKADTFQIKRTKEHFKHITYIVKLYVKGVEQDIFSPGRFTPDMIKASQMVN